MKDSLVHQDILLLSGALVISSNYDAETKKAVYFFFFKWRLLINITLSYLVAFLIYSILGIIFDRIIPIAIPNEMRYALCYAISFYCLCRNLL